MRHGEPWGWHPGMFMGRGPWGNLLEAAETACTRAKQAGRDRSVHRG